MIYLYTFYCFFLLLFYFIYFIILFSFFLIRVLATITSEIVEPYPDRPNEGNFLFNVEFSTMADPTFEAGRPSEYAIEVCVYVCLYCLCLFVLFIHVCVCLSPF